MSMNQMGGWMQNQGTGGQDPASKWLHQQGQTRPAPQGQTGQQIAQAAANARYAANGGRAPASPAQAMAPHPAMQGNYGGMQAAQQAANHPALQAQGGWTQQQSGSQNAIHPAVQQALAQQAHLQSQMQGVQAAHAGYNSQPASNYGSMQAAQAQAFAPHPAMAAQQGWMQPQMGGGQAAIHPAMQQALDQQAHLQSQLGAMRVQPQTQWNAGPTMGSQMTGASPWGGR